ncbi:GNAT family N-acetyltransferase [Pseudomonas sp. B21-012]|uniref:GNAT family N-acetyltransferase n=1 Tax=Pseudomonas sp. B21-012 TaxID=2895472 RepID=UPI00215F884E|nr:GNAT family N-acetyltransferase [Pseudomonas sp. B21-012]UVM58016.1 GNAT family N-acetyltransferase [Pseudomonas sp. B21-012]
MPALHHFVAPPAEPIKSQILQMVVDYLTDISSVALAPSNPLYSLYQYGIGFEVHLYLQAMDGSRGIPVELIVALDLDDPEQVVGFLLYLPLKDDPQACSVAYLAVHASHRRQGIARAMLAQMTARYPQAELGCVASKVPVFEALGFQVTGARGPQVLMNTHAEPSAGMAAVLDVAPIYRTLEVQQIHSYLLKQHGKRAMVDAEKQRDRHLDQLSRKARALALERLGQGPWLEGGRGLRLV